MVGITGGHPRNERYLGSLKQFVLNNKLQDLVTIIDQPSDIRNQMATSDVVLMFSESESFSLVCLEALASGRPVLATKCGGPQEIIRHQTNGLLIENRDVKAMARAIIKFYSEPDFITRYSTNGRIDFNNKFNADILADQLYAVYNGSYALSF
jgi:glycosyltransferase involved in cell wall biosynthesis